MKKKTQFVVSGKSPLQNPTLHLDQDIITPCTEIKHLGFTWSLKSKKMRIQQHVEKRICAKIPAQIDCFAIQINYPLEAHVRYGDSQPLYFCSGQT